MLVERKQLTQSPSGSPHRFDTEASDLALKPGSWPEQLPVEEGFGNGRPLIRWGAPVMSRGEILAVEYRQDLGCVIVRVYND